MKRFLIFGLFFLLHACGCPGVFAQTYKTNSTDYNFEHINSKVNFVLNPYGKTNTNSITPSTSPAASKNRVLGAAKINGEAANVCNTTGGVGAYCQIGIRTPTAPYNSANKMCDVAIYYQGTTSALYSLMVGTAPVPLSATTSGEFKEAYMTLPCSVAAPTVRVQQTTAGSATNLEYAVYYGPSLRLGSITQSYKVGSVKITGCATTWSTTSGSFTNVSAVSGCTYAVTGNLLAPTTNIPGFRMANVATGSYRIFYSGARYKPTTLGGIVNYRITDGTQNAEPSPMGASATSDLYAEGFNSELTYSQPQGTTTFQIQLSATGSNTAELQQGTFDVYFFSNPASSNVAIVDTNIPRSWSGYHDSTCSWSRTNTVYGDPTADASCGFVQRANSNFPTVASVAGFLPGITFTPAVTEKLFVCAFTTGYQNTGTNSNGIQLVTDTGVQLSESAQAALVSNTPQSYPNCGTLDVIAGTATTIKLQSKSGANTITMGNNGGSAVEWKIVSYTSAVNGVVKIDPPVKNVIRFTTAGAATYNRSSDQVKWIEIEMVGAGGGGGGSGTAAGTNGGAGGNTTFSTFLTANGGAGGGARTVSASTGGLPIVNSPAQAIVSLQGGAGGGGSSSGSATTLSGGAGGVSFFGGSGAPGSTGAADNSGSGGPGGRADNVTNLLAGAGGAAGAYVRAYVLNPASSYSLNIGAAGTAGAAGTSGNPGGLGGSGVIIVTEHFTSFESALFSGLLAKVLPQTAGSVTTTSTTDKMNFFSGLGNGICSTSPCPLFWSVGITNITTTGTGVYTINVPAGSCSQNLACTITSNEPQTFLNSSSTTTFGFITRNSSSAVTNAALSFQCSCPKP